MVSSKVATPCYVCEYFLLWYQLIVWSKKHISFWRCWQVGLLQHIYQICFKIIDFVWDTGWQSLMFWLARWVFEVSSVSPHSAQSVAFITFFLKMVRYYIKWRTGGTHFKQNAKNCQGRFNFEDIFDQNSLMRHHLTPFSDIMTHKH